MKTKNFYVKLIIASIIAGMFFAGYASASHTVNVTLDKTFVKGGATATYTFNISNNGADDIFYINIPVPSVFSGIGSITCPDAWASQYSDPIVKCLWSGGGNITSGASALMSFSATAPTPGADTQYLWNVTTYAFGIINGSTNNATNTTVDVTVPVTNISIGNPGYYNGSVYFVNSSTLFTLSASDTGGSGVNLTQYRIDSGAWVNYLSPFNASAIGGAGSHTIYYNSTDNLSNTETTKNISIYVDTTAPAVSLVGVSIWQNTNATANVTCSDTDGSGCNASSYGYNFSDATRVTCPTDESAYTFGLGASVNISSHLWVCVYAEDNVTNSNVSSPAEFKVDELAPTITNNYISLSGVWVNSDQNVTLIPLDTGGSDIKNVTYCNGTDCDPINILESPYQLNFTGSQNTTVRYQTWDNAGSNSSIGSFVVLIDETAPVANVSGASGDWQNTDATATVTCSDSTGSGCDVSSYRLYISTELITSCPTGVASYNETSPQTISRHSWVCSYVKDNVSNDNFSAGVTEFIVDEIKPACAVSGVMELVGGDYMHVSGTTVYYNPSGSNSGSFNVTVDSTDSGGSGMNNVTFPATVSGGESVSSLPYAKSYDWDGADGSDYAEAMVSCYDNAGNTNTSTFSVLQDTAAPVTAASANKTSGGEYLFDTWVNRSVNVSFSCVDGSGSGCGTILYCNDTNNECVPGTIYSGPVLISTEGVSYIRYLSNDSVNNTEETKNRTIKIDTVSPIVTATANKSDSDEYVFGAWTNSSYVNVTLSCSDAAGSGCNVTLYCTSDDAGCIPSIPYMDGTPAQVTLQNVSYIGYLANDSVNNTASVVYRTIKLDTLAPVSADDVAAPAWSSTDLTVTLTVSGGGSDINLTQYCIADTGETCTPNVTYSAPFNVTCEAGSVCNKTVMYNSTDNAGNVETTKTSNGIWIDMQVPAVSELSVNVSYAKSASMIRVNATVSDGGGSGIYNVSANNLSMSRASGDIYSITTNGAALGCGPDATCLITINATDNAGNSNASPQTSYIIDDTAPITSAAAVNSSGGEYLFDTWSNRSVNVSFSCDNVSGSACGTTIYCNDTGNVCVPGMVYSGPVQIPTEGVSYIRYLSNDSVNNTEEAKNQTIKIDTTVPEVSLNNVSTWQNTNATAILGCVDTGGSGCNASSYGYNFSGTNPGSCPSGKSAYTFGLGASADISSYLWVCAYAEDNVTNANVSSPAEFKVDEINPAGALSGVPVVWDNTNASIGLTCDDAGGADAILVRNI